MGGKEIARLVIKTIADAIGKDANTITRATTLAELEKVGCYRHGRIFAALEIRFEIDPDKKKESELKTIDDIIKLVEQQGALEPTTD
ncbi:hypothetical protein CL614_01205 [archaeon]|nr:hypothetical protein [archaeon]